MGLLDVLNGMQNGPRGQTNPNAQGGMSPITMAILALLAYKGIKHLSGGQQQPAPGGTPQRLPSDNPINTGAPSGGLGDILGGLLGGGAGRGGVGGGSGAVDLAAVDLAVCSRAGWAVCSPAARPAAC